jgi:3-dehydroquinate synthase
MIVAHSRGSYPIHFCAHQSALSGLPERSILLVDENVAHFHASILPSLPTIVVPSGEKSKSLQMYGDLAAKVLGLGGNRKSTLLALGGGVVGDLVGYLAATFMRGVPFIQIPTTLLSQVDSSVGGKVGIDVPAGKNLLGSFHPPVEVRISTDFLSTLPLRQFNNGMAEVWKMGYISDQQLLQILRDQPVGPDSNHLADVIRTSVDGKRNIVEADEFEIHGQRATLNFGHTIGHAIEQQLQYEGLLHGEAIAIGMVLESQLGETLGLTPAGTTEAISADMKSQGLPTQLPPNLSTEGLLEAMTHDKKRMSTSKLAFSLITGPGTCKLFNDVETEAVLAVLKNS